MFKQLAVALTLATSVLSLPSFANSKFGPARVIGVGISDAPKLTVTFELIDPATGQMHSEPCDTNLAYAVTINPDSEFRDHMFSLAVAAKASGKPIYGWVNGCHTFDGIKKSPKLTVLSLSE